MANEISATVDRGEGSIRETNYGSKLVCIYVSLLSSATHTTPRSWDGLTLYAASSDGTLAVFNFDPEELEGIAPHSVQEQYLQKFGFSPPPLPEGFTHQVPASAGTSRITPPPSPSRAKSPTPHQSQTGFGGANGINGGGGEVINKLVAKRSNKKRIQPSFAGSLSTSIPSASNVSLKPPASVTAPPSGMMPSRQYSAGTSNIQPPSAYPVTQPHSHSMSPIRDNWPHGGYDADVDMSGPMDMDVPIDSLSTGGNSLKGKRKASAFDLTDDAKPSKPRTLGGDRPRDSVVVREIGPGISIGDAWVGPNSAMAGVSLPVPPLYNSLSVKVEGSDDILEARNPEDDGVYLRFLIYSHGSDNSYLGPIEVMLVGGKQTLWLDYLPSRVLAMTATASFSAVAMQDGSVNVYSGTGRRSDSL